MARNLVIICSPGGLGTARLSYLRALVPLNAEIVEIGPSGLSSAFSKDYRDKKKTGKLAALEVKCLDAVHTVGISFSAGYGFFREWFKEGGIDLLDHYLAIDSIHGTHALDNVSQFVEFAKVNHLTIQHTDIEPYSYASTTDVANHIKERAPVKIFHTPGNDRLAHIKSLTVEGPRILEEYLVPKILGEEVMLEGLDISHHQPHKLVNWANLARNYDFLIARSNYGVRPDKEYPEHVANARQRGLRVGAYTFFRQTQRAEDQYNAFVDYANLQPGDILPIVDLESNEAYDGKVDPKLYNTRGKKLCDMLAEKYGGCIIYISFGFWQLMGKPDWILEHDIWTAHWNVAKPYWPDKSRDGKDWVIWQHSVKKDHEVYRHGPLDMNVAKTLPLVPSQSDDDDEGDEEPESEPHHDVILESFHEMSLRFDELKSELSQVEAKLSELVTLLVDRD